VPPPAVDEPPSGVLWGSAALALIGTATAIALEEKRRRQEEEARLREEMAERNAALAANEAAEAAAIAAAREAREAEEALLAGPDADEWQEEETAARDAGRDQAQEALEESSAHVGPGDDTAPPVIEPLSVLVESSGDEPWPVLDDVAFEVPLQGDYHIPLVPTSALASTEYLINYRLRLRSPAQAPSVVVSPDGFELPQREPPQIPGNWSYNLRDGSTTATRSAPWTIPIHGYDNSFAQLRWSTSWGIGNYGGEFGLRLSLSLDSRVVIGGYEISNSTASLVATQRFRPQNILVQWALSAAVATAVVGGPAVWAALAGSAGGVGAYQELAFP
jgi:hypothetical protein